MTNDRVSPLNHDARVDILRLLRATQLPFPLGTEKTLYNTDKLSKMN